jgi:hypothetical protein
MILIDPGGELLPIRFERLSLRRHPGSSDRRGSHTTPCTNAVVDTGAHVRH